MDRFDKHFLPQITLITDDAARIVNPREKIINSLMGTTCVFLSNQADSKIKKPVMVPIGSRQS